MGSPRSAYSKAQRAVLFVPLDRELLEEIRKLESSWLSTFQDART
jgi:hypothetical protein